MTNLAEACSAVMAQPTLKEKYPMGLNSMEILSEVRVLYGEGAFPYCTVIDVADEMRKMYPW